MTGEQSRFTSVIVTLGADDTQIHSSLGMAVSFWDDLGDVVARMFENCVAPIKGALCQKSSLVS
ncbi:hypothetical protein N7453_002167 [Penicillium expansum]|nr:hypothetical protein N7453_002167 [Penicillium expansum]